MKFSIIFFLLFLPFFCNANPTSQNITSIFAFGDSYTDTGNFVIMLGGAGPGIAIANPPYGMTYFGHPTGRCSDGRLIVDFMAEEYGLPLLIPYQAHSGSFIQGSNFAVAGATAINVEFFEKNNFVNFPLLRNSLDYQLTWFEDVKSTLCNSTEECKNFFSTSLFMIGEFGANDYSFILQAGRSVEEVKNTYVPFISS
ncbi:hypothetical protein LUZ60_009714 [Juncus effusus]|nr:hypothetical protein LUZ60_009714 [Juncus effusus]